jgi:hypothetical protein
MRKRSRTKFLNQEIMYCPNFADEPANEIQKKTKH